MVSCTIATHHGTDHPQRSPRALCGVMTKQRAIDAFDRALDAICLPQRSFSPFTE